MDLSRARVVLRQRSTLDVFDLALRFVVANGSIYAKVTLLTVVPLVLISWSLAAGLGWFWGWTLTLLLALWVEAPFTVLASRLLFDRDVRVRDVLGAFLRASPRLLLLRVAQVVAVLLGLTLLVVPGIWLATLSLFVVEAVLLERATLSAAISRSQRLTGSRSGQAIAALSLLFLLHAAATFLGDDVGRFVVSSLLQFREPESLLSAGGSPLALVGFWLFLPYAATARFFTYLDLRTRSEGWDIQTRFAAIALRAAENRKAA